MFFDRLKNMIATRFFCKNHLYAVTGKGTNISSYETKEIKYGPYLVIASSSEEAIREVFPFNSKRTYCSEKLSSGGITTIEYDVHFNEMKAEKVCRMPDRFPSGVLLYRGVSTP